MVSPIEEWGCVAAYTLQTEAQHGPERAIRRATAELRLAHHCNPDELQ